WVHDHPVHQDLGYRGDRARQVDLVAGTAAADVPAAAAVEPLAAIDERGTDAVEPAPVPDTLVAFVPATGAHRQFTQAVLAPRSGPQDKRGRRGGSGLL